MEIKLQRTCIGCRLKKNKNKLVRIVKNNQNIVNIDLSGKQEGRGAYICNNILCLEKAIKAKRLEKSLKIKLTDEIYENLKKIINGGEFIGKNEIV